MLQSVWLHFLEFNELENLDCNVRGRYKRHSWLLGNDSSNKKMKKLPAKHMVAEVRCEGRQRAEERDVCVYVRACVWAYVCAGVRSHLAEAFWRMR